MKKVLILCLALLLTFTLCSCWNNANCYPANEEMKANLENNGYDVSFYEDISKCEDFSAISANCAGTLIKATKGDEYIYFARLDNAENCDGVYDILESICKNYNALVLLENDEKFGNIVYCATTDAVKFAGIQVVKVDVDVKV